MIGKYRSWYETKFEILGEKVAKLRITPNQLTLVSIIPGIFSCYFFSERKIIIGVIFMLLSFFIDALDGSLARTTGKITKTGKILDPVADRYIEFLIIFGVALGKMAEFWIAFYCLFGMIMASYARARAESVENIDLMSVGIMERQEKFLLLLIGILLFNFYSNSLNYALFTIGTLSHITVVQRILYVKKKVRE